MQCFGNLLSWNVCKSVLASGSAVANSESANCNGVCDDLLKSILEKLTAPDVTSGTFEMVVAESEQVITFWMDVTESLTSAGSAVSPTTKHAAAWRGVKSLVGRAMARLLRSVMVAKIWACMVALWLKR